MRGLILCLLLCGCASPVATTCPPWPAAGPAVADELERALSQPEAWPAAWDWIDRLYKLKDQLAGCR